MTLCSQPERLRFQSTCPARGTTVKEVARAGVGVISIHVPREGHDAQLAHSVCGRDISIHVPREGHDTA